jgi:sulfur carrier protein ThiS
MSAQFKLVGLIKSYVGGESEIMVASGKTIRESIKALGIPSEIVALVTVNHTHQSKDYVVQEGDMITLLAVVGGG